MARTYLHARWLCFWMAFFGRNDFHDFSGSARGDSGIPVYPKKICQNTQNSSKYTQNYTQVYFIPEIQRKWYTEYPYLSYNIPYSRFKKPLYTVYPKTLADPDLDSQKCWMLYCHVISFGRVVGGRWLHLEIWLQLKMMPNFWFQKRNLLI